MKKIIYFLILLTGSLFLTSCFNNIEEENIYKIEYYVDNNKVDLSPNIYFSDLKTYLPYYEQEGYLFSGWYTNNEYNGNIVNAISEGESGDKKFYGKLEKLYELTLVFNGGTEVDYRRYFTAEEVTVLPENIIKDNLQFAGWYDNPDFVGEAIYLVPEGTRNNVTYYAKFTDENVVEENYYLTLEFNGGESVYYEDLISKEEDYYLPLDIYKENYEFIGWYYFPFAEGERVYKIDKNTNNDITLFAVFELSSTLFDMLVMPNTEELVVSNLEFPSLVNDFHVTITSSDENIIDNEGILKRDYNETYITITASITDYTSTISKDYTYVVDSYKSLDGPIRSGYILREYFKVNDYYFDNQEIIYTAFANADTNGDFPNINNYLANVRSNIMPKAKERGVYVIMSVGPESRWDYFSKEEHLREHFADNIVLLINEHGFDGVDIDWEVPRPHLGEDLLYTLLMEVVHRKVKENNPNHLVTTAITGGNSQPPKYDLRNSGKYLDYINIMTYGMASSGGLYQNALYDRSTYHNNELRVGRPPSQATIHDSIRIFNNFGIESKRLIVGVAFYGMKHTRVYNESTNTYSSWIKSGGGLKYEDILVELSKPGYTRVYDEISQVPYIINSEGTVFISYDDDISIKVKAEYILANNIAGMMYWEYFHDHNNILLEAMAENMPRN